MLSYIKEFDRYLEITGFKNVKFSQAEKFLKKNRKELARNFDVQFFDAQLIASSDHLYFAILNSLQAFHYKNNISKSLAMETMLYASSQRQIKKAIELIGVKEETKNIAVIFIGQDPTILETALESFARFAGVETDEKVLEMSKAKEESIKKIFQISEEEIDAILKDNDYEKAVVNLVIERVALLSVRV